MSRLAFVACLSVLCLRVVVGSQVEAPSPPEQPSATTDGDGDRESAPQIRVTVESAEPSAEVTEQNRQDRERELQVQEAIGNYTRLLVFVGVAQVLTAALGFWVAMRAARAARDSATAAAKSASVAESALTMSLEARLNFHSASLLNLQKTLAPTVVVQIKNYGGRAGVIKCHQITAGVFPTLPAHDAGDMEPIDSPIEVGQAFTRRMRLAPISPADWDEMHRGALYLFVWGFLDYDNGLGHSRRIGFARAYDAEMSRNDNSPHFSIVGGSTYNYVS